MRVKLENVHKEKNMSIIWNCRPTANIKVIYVEPDVQTSEIINNAERPLPSIICIIGVKMKSMEEIHSQVK